jgi:hypothetical protein
VFQLVREETNTTTQWILRGADYNLEKSLKLKLTLIQVKKEEAQ